LLFLTQFLCPYAAVDTGGQAGGSGGGKGKGKSKAEKGKGKAVDKGDGSSGGKGKGKAVDKGDGSGGGKGKGKRGDGAGGTSGGSGGGSGGGKRKPKSLAVKQRVRRPSERINNIQKKVVNKDGIGFSETAPLTLDD